MYILELKQVSYSNQICYSTADCQNFTGQDTTQDTRSTVDTEEMLTI